MPTLYVTEQGSVVRKSKGSIIVTQDDYANKSGSSSGRRRTLLEVEPHRLELIALVGRVHITSSATHVCLRSGIAVAWFRSNGDFVGRLVPELSRTADLRLAQFRMVCDDDRSLDLARTIIAAKLRSAISVLSAVRSNRPGKPALGEAISALSAVPRAIQGATTKEELMGFEGIAARHYFAGLRVGFDQGLSFTGRARRPPPDPVNSLLSFGYVIVVNALASLLEARGFDPYLGFFHSVRSGRPSLALDLTEELRHPVVDRFVLRACNLRQLREEHFEPDHKRGGVRLTKIGLRTFFRNWEAFMDKPLPGLPGIASPETLMRQQADRVAAHVRGNQNYVPIFPA